MAVASFRTFVVLLVLSQFSQFSGQHLQQAISVFQVMAACHWQDRMLHYMVHIQIFMMIGTRYGEIPE